MMEETIGKVGNFHFFGWPRFDTVRLGEWMTGMIHEPVYRGAKTAKHGVDVSGTTYYAGLITNMALKAKFNSVQNRAC